MKNKKCTCYPHLEPMNSCKTTWTIAPGCRLDDLYGDELYELCKSNLLRITELDARLAVSRADYDREFSKNVALTEDLCTVNSENRKLANENKELKKGLEYLRDDRDKFERMYRDSRAGVESLERVIRDLTEEKTELEKKKFGTPFCPDCEAYKRDNAALRDDIERVIKERDEYVAKCGELEEENEKIKGAKFVYMEEMCKAQRERNESVDRCVKAEMENDKLLDELGKAAKEVEQYRGRCNALENDVAAFRRRLGELTFEKEGVVNRLGHLLESDFIRSFDNYDPKTGTYKRDISEADKLVTLKEFDELDRLRVEYDYIRKKNEELKSALDDVKHTRDSLRWALGAQSSFGSDGASTVYELVEKYAQVIAFVTDCYWAVAHDPERDAYTIRLISKNYKGERNA